MITVKDLVFSFPKTQEATISHVDLTIKDNEFLTIVGKSGCGKSTLLRLLAGLLAPDSGEMLFNQQALNRSQVGYMPQKDTLLPWKTVKQNIRLAQTFDSSIQFSENELDYWLEQANLSGYGEAFPDALSGGMKQRAAFLRTLLTQRPVLMLDEPFGALDSFTRNQMQEWLVHLWEQEKKTVVLISHDLEEALLLSDRIAIMTKEGMHIFPVELPRPRHSKQRFSKEFIQQREQLERILTNEK